MGLFATYTKDDTTAVKETNDTVGKKAEEFLTSPFSFKEDELVSKKNRAVHILAWATIAAAGAEYFGHVRERQGKGPLIPGLA